MRDEVLPLVHLSDIFQTKNELSKQKELFVVVVGLANQKMGVIVDYLVGQEEVVIKSLGEYLKNIPGIAGATVRGDGKIALIIDVVSMIEMGKSVQNNLLKQILAEKEQKKQVKNLCILIVDDSSTGRKIARDYLSKADIQSLEAQNGIEALEILKDSNNQIDAVLIDIEMPKMDGYTLAQEIRKINQFRTIPLIATTTLGSKDNRIKGLEAGMNDYLTKPYSKSYFWSVLKKNLKLDEDLA